MQSLNTQIGGTHYSRWKIQPVEFWIRNGWDGCAGSSLKYICRHDAKDGKQALDKAFHFGELRRDLLPLSNTSSHLYSPHRITMGEFIIVNGIVREAPVLVALDAWVSKIDYQGERYFAELRSLRTELYGL